MRPNRALTIALCILLFFALSCSKDNNISQQTNNNYTTINNVTQIVGQSGGHVENSDGAMVDIPAGALTQDVTIKIGTVKDGAPKLPDGYSEASKYFAFEPHGLTFGGAVVISLPNDAGTTKVGMLRAEPNEDWISINVTDVTSTRLQANTTTFSFFVAAVDSNGGTGGSANLCNDTCIYANNGSCDDGTLGTAFEYARVCSEGTDCTDCTNATDPPSELLTCGGNLCPDATIQASNVTACCTTVGEGTCGLHAASGACCDTAQEISVVNACLFPNQVP